jgi:hypothetical protein
MGAEAEASVGGDAVSSVLDESGSSGRGLGWFDIGGSRNEVAQGG